MSSNKNHSKTRSLFRCEFYNARALLVNLKGGVFMQVFGYVYLLVDETNGKMYVGKTTKTVEERFQKHRYSDTLIGKMIRKHKPENFKREVLKICYSEAELNAWEKFFIAALKTKAPYGYNLADGGKGDRGGKSGLRRGYSPFKNLLVELDARKMTYESFAHFLGLSKQSVSDKMHGRVRFTMKDQIKLVKLFNKPIEYLLQRVDGKNSTSRRWYSSFKNLLIELDERGLNYTEFAKLLEQSFHSISAKMCGTRNFTEHDKAKLVEIFGKPIEYLLERTDG